MIESTDDPAVIRQIERHLLTSLSAINRQATNRQQSFCMKDREERLIAGLTCSTAYGWLHVESLWVADDHRTRGLGRNLMAAAEAFGRQQGCHGAWLDTSNPGAQAFYCRLGYVVFGKLANGESRCPAEHRRWFLKRAL